MNNENNEMILDDICEDLSVFILAETCWGPGDPPPIIPLKNEDIMLIDN